MKITFCFNLPNIVDKLYYFLFVLMLLLINSCEVNRIDLISTYSGLSLPNNYRIIQNTSESSGFAGSDYEIIIILDFEQEIFNEVVNQINELVLVNSYWTLTDGSYKYYFEINVSEFENIELDFEKRRLKYTMTKI